MKDTLRLIISQTCNFSCSYCCNTLPETINKIKKVDMTDLPLLSLKYEKICITGGEPLLNLHRLNKILCRIPTVKPKYLYTNGYPIYEATEKLSKLPRDCSLPNSVLELTDMLNRFMFINIGVHVEQLTSRGIDVGVYMNSIHDFLGENVRFQIQDKYAHLMSGVDGAKYKVWTLNKCDMPNEDLCELENN